jgi:hypothetical protein
MRLFLSIALIAFISGCKNGSHMPLANSGTQQKIFPIKSFFVSKTKRQKSTSTIGNAFVSNVKNKRYGEKAQGKRIGKSKVKTRGNDISSGNFTVSPNHYMDYGNKAQGKKIRKFKKRKIESTNSWAGDAFASYVKLNKNAPYNFSKGRQKNLNAETGKKRKKFNLFRFKLFRSKEERQMRRRNKTESSYFEINTREERKAMKKQKKKREYGLGLPSH